MEDNETVGGGGNETVGDGENENVSDGNGDGENETVGDGENENVCDGNGDGGNETVGDRQKIPAGNRRSDTTDEEGEEPKTPIKLRKFSCHISYEIWSKMKIKETEQGERKFSRGWTDIVYKEIEKVHPTCPLVFKNHSIRKKKSRKKNTPYFAARACCKFPNCVRFKLCVKDEPEKGREVKLKVKPEKSHRVIKHEKGVVKARFLTGNERKEIADHIKVKGVSTTYYDLLGSKDDGALEAGNVSGVGSKTTLQKISSEINTINTLHRDVVSEVSLLKTVYEKEDDSGEIVRGCIQSVSLFPFNVTMYSAEQLNILADRIHDGDAVLYFDATGQVVSKVPYDERKVLYYPLLLKPQTKGDPPLPIAELISSSHNTVDVATFLMKVNRDLHIISPSAKMPQRIEVDYSWALIHGILLAFNQEHISDYLNRSWDYMKGSSEWGHKTKVHICSAHILHGFSRKMASCVQNKKMWKYVLYAIARMVDSSQLIETDTIFRDLCIILLSDTVDSHAGYSKAISDIDNIIMKDITVSEMSDDEEQNDPPKTFGKINESVFGRHFRQIEQEVKASMTSDAKGQIPNIYHAPDLVQHLLNKYMGIMPLWTGAVLEGVTHDTNSPVENWNKIVKNDILHNKKKLRPGHFIIEMRANMKGRLKEYRLKHQSMQSMASSKTHKKKIKRKSKDNLSTEEGWKKRTKEKGTFFQMPDTPKRKKSIFFSERSLHWGGTVELPDRTVFMSNTCPVDNNLVLLHYLLKHPELKQWFEVNRTLDVCRVLLEVHNLFEARHWYEGRAIWICAYCPPPSTSSWNMFGSEAELFVQHFSMIQETSAVSRCSKRRCFLKEKNIRTTEIFLGDTDPENKMISLQDSISQWETTPDAECLAGPKGSQCRGMRSREQRQFVHGFPPVLILSASFLSQERGLTAKTLPDNASVLNHRYNLFGYTLREGSHFKAYFRHRGRWCRYDGLCDPEIVSVLEPGCEGNIEHVVMATY